MNFAITPDQATLQQIDRQLSFHPSPVADPQTLTREQLDAYNCCGYITPLTLFDDGDADELRQYFDGLLAKVLAAGGSSYSISSAHLLYGRVYDLLTHPRLVAHAKDILGEDVVGWGSHFFCKLPGDGKRVAWHQDASYWPLTPAKTVTVWLAIDDADAANGCMRFLPGTHTLGHLTYRMTEDKPNDVLDQEVDNVEQFGDPVDNVLGAGQFSLHTDLLLHGSEPNNSDRRRCGLTLRYCAADVRAYEGWNRKGVIVSGSDPSGHWSNPPRPDVE